MADQCEWFCCSMFLGADHIYCRAFFDWKQPIAFKELRLMTLLAVKYRVERIITHAIACLEATFPTKFFPDHFTGFNYVDDTHQFLVLCRRQDCIGAIALARAIDHDNPPAFIASTLYYCCQLSLHGTLLDVVPYSEDKVQLERRDLAACMTRRTLLLEADKGIRKPLLRAYDGPLCVDRDCINGVGLIMARWMATGRFARFTVLRSSGAWFAEHARRCPDWRLCYKCKESIENAIDEQRERVFRNLGRVFKIDGWQAQY